MTDSDPVREIERILRRGPRPERILDVRFSSKEGAIILRELDREIARLGARPPRDGKL